MITKTGQDPVLWRNPKVTRRHFFALSLTRKCSPNVMHVTPFCPEMLQRGSALVQLPRRGAEFLGFMQRVINGVD